MATDNETITDLVIEQKFNKYDVKTTCTELTIITADKPLYYTRYILARESEYFNKKFTGKMDDATENTVHMKEYDSVVIEMLLTLLDDKKRAYSSFIAVSPPIFYSLIDLLNYYQFSETLRDILKYIDKNEYLSMQFVNFIANDKFVNGVYGKEFKATINEQIRCYTLIIFDTEKTEPKDAHAELDKLQEIRQEYVHVAIHKAFYDYRR